MTVPTEVEALVADARLSAHLATSVDDRPHVAPVWYVYEDGTLSVLTGGHKLRNLRRNPRVAVSIEKATERGVEWNVTLLGTARVVDDAERYREVGRRLNAKYGGGDSDDGYDGGENATDEPATDGGTEGALVEITVASASYNRY